MQKIYIYEGPVLKFGKCIEKQWCSTTYAPTARKAKSNLAYQYKRHHNMLPSSAVTLPGKVKEIRGDI